MRCQQLHASSDANANSRGRGTATAAGATGSVRTAVAKNGKLKADKSADLKYFCEMQDRSGFHCVPQYDPSLPGGGLDCMVNTDMCVPWRATEKTDMYMYVCTVYTQSRETRE